MNKSPAQKSFQIKRYRLGRLQLKTTPATKLIPTISGPTSLTDTDGQNV